MNRTDRLTGILLALRGGPTTAARLAARFEVSRRTILRDINSHLEEQMYEIWWPQGWYRQAWTPTLKNFRPHGFMGTSTCYSCEQMVRAWHGSE